MLRNPLLVLALAAALISAGACSSESNPGSPPPSATTLDQVTERGPYGVGVTEFQIVDTSRPTEKLEGTAGAPERTLPVVVWYPADPAAAAPEQPDAPLAQGDAPYPLIVFAHGISAFPRQAESYTQHLASHGYVVAAPEFPVTHLGAPGGIHLAGVINQPGDVSFVIDEVLRMSSGASGVLSGSVDDQKIGVTGHSLGGFTALLVPYGPAPDDRIDAVVSYSPTGCFLGDASGSAPGVPTLVIGGTNDLLVGPASIRAGYDRIPPPKYWVDIAGADHTRFADVDLSDEDIQASGFNYTGENVRDEALQIIQATGADPSACLQDEEPAAAALISADRQRELLRAFATPFFDAHLKGSDDALAFFEEELPEMVIEATFESEVN
jgi:predicted dienelactone hydrolase